MLVFSTEAYNQGIGKLDSESDSEWLSHQKCGAPDCVVLEPKLLLSRMGLHFKEETNHDVRIFCCQWEQAIGGGLRDLTHKVLGPGKVFFEVEQQNRAPQSHLVLQATELCKIK